MPAFVPPIPAAGEPIASAWGKDVHNRLYSPVTCIATGNQQTGIVGAERPLPIDTVTGGMASMADLAADEFVIPAGYSGSWLFIANVRVNNLAAGKIARFRFRLNGSARSEGCTIPGAAGSSAWGQLVMWYNLQDGQRMGINYIPDGSAAADYILISMMAIRQGNIHGTSAGG